MTSDDEKEFIEFLKKTGDVVILPYMSVNPEFKQVETLPEQFSEAFWNSFCIYNRGITKNLVTVFVPEQRHYVIDKSGSSIIEFLRCFLEMEKNTLHPGRIWTQFDYLDRERMVILPKGPEFKAWYEKIARWLRKNYERVHGDHYAGPGAQRFVEDGGTLAEM